MAQFTAPFSSGWATLIVNLSESGTSSETNTGVISYSMYIRKDKTCYSHNNKGSASISLDIGGSRRFTGNKFDIQSLAIGSSKLICSDTFPVTHDNEGNLSLAVKAEFTSGVQLGNASITDIFTGTHIPRASTISNISETVTAGNFLDIALSRKVDTFKHKVEISLEGYNAVIDDVETSVSFEIPTDWVDAITDSPSGKATVTVTTYSGDTKIGSAATAYVEILVPDTEEYYPVINSVDISEAVSAVADAFSNRYLQGVSQLKVSVDAAGVLGSTIRDYLVTIEGTTYPYDTFTSNVINSAGYFELIASVTDSRGRITSKRIQLYAFEYQKPVITSMRYIPLDDNNEQNSDGTRTKVIISGKIYPVGNANTKALRLEYKKLSDEKYTERTVQIPSDAWEFTVEEIILNTDPTVTYEYKAYVSDKAFEALPFTITTGKVVVSRKAGGNGVTLFEEAKELGFVVGAGLPSTMNDTTIKGTLFLAGTGLDGDLYRPRYRDAELALLSDVISGGEALGDYLPLAGGTMTGEIIIGQGDGKGIQLGIDGRINATSNGNTTCTICGISGANALLGHSSFNATFRGKAARPTYNGYEIALHNDLSSYLPLSGGTITDDLQVAGHVQLDKTLSVASFLTVGEYFSIDAEAGRAHAKGASVEDITFTGDISGYTGYWLSMGIYDKGFRIGDYVGNYEYIDINIDPTTNVGIVKVPSQLIATGGVDIRGNAASMPLKVRGIAGSDGEGTVAELYLQYGANKAIHLGNSGAYTISADGGTYSGTAAKAIADGSGNIIVDTYAAKTELNKKANDFSIEIYNGTGGNPKPVRFASFNYSTCNSENGIAAKISLVSGHGNGSSYAFLEDAIIRVSYTGNVEVDNFKYYGADTGTYDGASRQYGDIFWIIDTTNKIVDFYCLMGQYARVYQTPWKRLTYSSGGTVTQYTNCTVYSSGTKLWANNSEYALLSDITNVGVSGNYAPADHDHPLPSRLANYQSSGGSDANGAVETGFYYINGSTNRPPFSQSTNVDYRILTTAYSDQWLQQIATDFRCDDIFYRRRESGTWTSWRKLAFSDTHLAGGLMTGSLKFQASSLPQKTLEFICGIDAFASGGEMGWQSKGDFLAGYATTAQLASYSLTSHNHDSVYAKTATANIYNGEQKFQNSSYCPTVTDTAAGVGCAFKASRGLANEMLVDKLIMTASAGKIPFYNYTGTSNGSMTGLTEIAAINSNGLYFPTNGVTVMPNTVSTYTPLRITGMRQSYCGVLFGDDKTALNIMSSNEHQGLYNESNGRWILYYNRTYDQMGIGTAPTTQSSYKLDVFGSTRVQGNLNVTGSLVGNSSSTSVDALATMGVEYYNFREYGGSIGGALTVNSGMYIAGRYYDSGDDEGLIIGKANNGYAGLTLGGATGLHTTLYLMPDNSAVWRYHNGSASYDIKHPQKAGTIALLSDIPSASSGSVKTMDVIWTNPSPTAAYNQTTLSLNVSPYRYIVMCCNFSTNYPKRIMPSGMCKVEAGYQGACITPDTVRTITIDSMSQVSIGGAGNGTNTNLVPCYIIGIY